MTKLYFQKAKPEDSFAVDPHFTENDPRVLVKPSEVPEPLYPGDPAMWDQIVHVVEEVELARRKADCRDNSNCMQKSVISKSGLVKRVGITKMNHAADIVHDDWPTDIILRAAKEVVGDSSTTWKKFGFAEKSIFTDRVVLLNALMGESCWIVSPSSFATKWHYRVARPEEAIYEILKGNMENVPTWVTDRLNYLIDEKWKQEILEDKRKFTMYPEGCPNHPSYTAMHSAAAGIEAAIIIFILDLSPAMRLEVLRTAYNMAMNRTIAGVHWYQDNMNGLWIGVEVAKRWLPGKMRSLGATEEEIAAAMTAVNLIDFEKELGLIKV